MQLASGTHIPDGLLAAMTLLNEKPRHGVARKNVASNPGIDERNSTVAIGFRASLALDAARQSERARYYSSNDARFMSPDWSLNPSPVPFASLSDPQSLNLYSYMRDNPLSGTDLNGHSPNWLQRFLNCFRGFCGMTNAQRSTAIATERNDLIVWQAKFNGKTPDYKNLSEGQIHSLYTQFMDAANAFTQRQQEQVSEIVALKFLHSEQLLENNSNINAIRQMPTQEIIDSLKPGQPGALKVKADGTVMDGNTRLRVLEERGVDINSLPRDLYTSSPSMAPWEDEGGGEGPMDPMGPM